MSNQEWMHGQSVDGAFESHNAIQYWNGNHFRIIYNEGDRTDLRDVNLADKYQRRLVWLKTLGGRWVIAFDRANASDPNIRLWFCKECGQPFDRLSDCGNHTRSEHNPNKAQVDKANAENADEEEERLVAAALSGEVAEPEVEQPIVLERRGIKKGKIFHCKTCGQACENLYLMREHNKIHSAAAAVPVPVEVVQETT